ncbi:hypothetical protein [Meiothermus taiwanensis]|nr:hypothetical protein [Meiothermus taiwanensis]
MLHHLEQATAWKDPSLQAGKDALEWQRVPLGPHLPLMPVL